MCVKYYCHRIPQKRICKQDNQWNFMLLLRLLKTQVVQCVRVSSKEGIDKVKLSSFHHKRQAFPSKTIQKYCFV